MTSPTTCLLAFLLYSATLSFATHDHHISITSKKGGGNIGGGIGGFSGPRGGFGIPGFGRDWGKGVGGGYGFGYGGPGGGYSTGGIISPTVVCKEKGPCYKNKLTCPAKCFSSFSGSGKGSGYGGGGGGCTMDCKKTCSAYC